jgi:hypothetical protein
MNQEFENLEIASRASNGCCNSQNFCNSDVTPNVTELRFQQVLCLQWFRVITRFVTLSNPVLPISAGNRVREQCGGVAFCHSSFL